jgi:hypothetical protein
VKVPDSTIEGVASESRARAAAWVRRGFLLLLLLVLVAALLGYLGVKKAKVSGSGHGYHLDLTYARIARAGLDVPWELTITHPGGFDGPVVVETTGAYFDIFESQGSSPEPTSETSDGDWDRMTFAKPVGDTLTIDLDIYVQPASQVGRSGTARVLDHGRPAASVDFKTWLLP